MTAILDISPPWTRSTDKSFPFIISPASGPHPRSSFCAFGAVITSHCTHGAPLATTGGSGSSNAIFSFFSSFTSIWIHFGAFSFGPTQPRRALCGRHNRQPQPYAFPCRWCAIHEFGTARTTRDWCLRAFHPVLSCVRAAARNMLVPSWNHRSPSLQYAWFFPRHSGVPVGVVATSRDSSTRATVTIPRTLDDGLS